ncbi:hypothetical protein EDI_073440 [Entamoeba dispar SAW760]|uniref:EGF-like domain-containing protein n=1 Tax=Entamoeba dispar (strain ATCC PRA-260 / SAW760) TaxID=370354 RepID=B0ECA0_ENTDS|nr:uncharacterized protein EDI_073440 [Entamoeba dispar SAW760]EDR27846.1 hypothetical protein EDI_073440 [Entamoeba dispar SAW760]|eukprot:EDR27846.1 hypothetical protein EDI_073440 [Entamoeba dispar SAW760]
MIYFILLFINFALSKPCIGYIKSEIDTVDSAFECIESIETTEEENEDIINGLKYYLEAYVFKDILKNPPQPSFSNNYYEKKHCALKCPHAQFTEARSAISIGSLNATPLSKEYLNTPITITWENEESVTVNYKIYRKSLVDGQMNELVYKKDHANGTKVSFTQEEINPGKEIVNTMKILEQYVSDDRGVRCVLTDSEINTLIVLSFQPDKKLRKSYEDTISKCIDLFDSNDYPIQVIFAKNGGGDAKYSQWIEKILAPRDDVNYIFSARESECSETLIRIKIGANLFNPETCRRRRSLVKTAISIFDIIPFEFPLGKWYTKPNIIKYGDVEHKITQPSINKWSPKKLMKNPRKPTDIVVYTDSFCYSACSEVTKGLKEWGGAILVGYDGDPYGEDDEFEVGQSPSSNIPNITELEPQNPFTQYGYKFGLTVLESYRFNYEYDESIPREFLTDMIDERVNIYSYPDRIDIFEEETKKIIEKYQTKCNPNNKRLVKRDEKCDKEINIEHGHGGYECGDNGEWSTKCVLSYCDPGYKFDYINNKCIEGVCSKGVSINIIKVVMIIGIITLIL